MGGGIESLECDTFDLYCFQAETGMKIFITTTKGVVDARGALRRVHQAYCDYALNCDLFDAAIANIADAINRA